MALSFRVATAADAPAIVALVESAYRGEGSKQGWTTEADFLEGQRTDLNEVLEVIAAPDQAIVLAFDQGILRATAQLDASAKPAAMFGMFAVDPTRQSGGVGKALLAECERRALADFACTEMIMWVIWLRESLIAFYQRRGYRINGKQHPFPYGDANFGLPKREDLYFIEMSKALST
jgi:GNAT superfamily N-acetyltransferase